MRACGEVLLVCPDLLRWARVNLQPFESKSNLHNKYLINACLVRRNQCHDPGHPQRQLAFWPVPRLLGLP